MSVRPLHHLPLYLQARQLRLAKAFTQSDVARLMNTSQAYISLLENGRRSPYEARRCLETIAAHRPNRGRTPGGDFKVGRLLSRYPMEISKFRGEPLSRDFDYARSLPEGDDWRLLALCRTAADAELAFLFHEDQEIFGLAGFHRIDGQVKRGRIIPISPELDENVSLALEAFARANIALEDNSEGTEQPAEDDGVLGDASG